MRSLRQPFLVFLTAGVGHVTWPLAGEQARLLRMKILGLFDGYPQIPHGFPYYSAATSSIPNGRIDAGEALAYTSFLATELEGRSRTEGGTRIGHFLFPRS